MNEQLIENYKNFLNNGKTERECVDIIIQMAEKNGYKSISSYNKLNPGDKVYITTTGWGHGVGMSQYGAQNMANDGYNYKEILSHYYTGVNFANVNSII